MRKSVAVVVAALASSLYALPAGAQSSRTFVSGVGLDANSCSRTAPCATFAGAMSKTAAGGEIDCLDSGGFGNVTINKSLTIDCTGVGGSILAVGGITAITVNAGPNDRVIVRNLNFTGAGSGAIAIRFLAGLHLIVENVRIANFTNAGIEVNTTTSGFIYVRDAVISNVPTGIRVSTTTGGGITAQIDNTRIDNVTNGLDVTSTGVFASISNSVVMAASGAGLLTSGPGFINASKTILARNGIGVNSIASGGSIRISSNALDDNTTGIAFANGGTVSSAGNNTVIGPIGQDPNGGAIPLD
jgi:hypothetical protein